MYELHRQTADFFTVPHDDQLLIISDETTKHGRFNIVFNARLDNLLSVSRVDSEDEPFLRLRNPDFSWAWAGVFERSFVEFDKTPVSLPNSLMAQQKPPAPQSVIATM